MSNNNNDVINIWEPKHTKDGAKNLNDFIEFAKNDLTIYRDQGWDASKWKPKKGQALVFGYQENNYSPVKEFEQPFLDFAKAFVRQQMAIKEITSAHIWIAMFRFLYEALKQQFPEKSIGILDVSGQTLRCTEQLIKASDNDPMRKYHIGGKLVFIASWLLEKRIVLTLPSYKNPFQKPPHKAEQLGSAADKFRAERCPSMHQMLCLADCFAKAQTVEDKYYTSALVLLCFAPGRTNELGGLTVHSLQRWDDGQWYVVWQGSKGYPDHAKGVPELMLDTVKEAFNRLMVIGEPARLCAKWAFENPDKFYRHQGCITDENHAESALLSHKEFAYAMNVVGSLHSANKERLNTPTKWINKLLAEGDFTYRGLNNLVRSQYINSDWPNNPDSGRPVWENLLLVRDKELKRKSSTKEFSWVMPNVDTFNQQITPKAKNMKTLWERFEMLDEDGSEINLTTHQLRVWLNTHGKIGGVDDWKIAQWSGRADMKQNAAYDLRTQDERESLGLQLLVKSYEDTPSAITLRKQNLPVPLKSLGIDREGVADFTGIGFCVHNFAQTPCTKSGECVTCKDHVCMTGIPETVEELEHLDKLIFEQLQHAKQASTESVYGADRWVTHLEWKWRHIHVLLEIAKDESVPKGTLISIPVDHDPSPTRLALDELDYETELEQGDESGLEEQSSPVNIDKLLGIT